MDGAWYDPEPAGQGFFIDAHRVDDMTFLFVAWFTYGDITKSGQRWVTGQGGFSGSVAELPIYECQGGSFAEDHPTETTIVGSMVVDFTDCAHAVLTYDLDEGTSTGSIDITRVMPESQALCEELNLE